MMPGVFGGEYQSQETRALRSIDQSKYPDTNKDLVTTLRRHGTQIDYMAKYMSMMQKGVDAANRNAIEQVQDFIADIVVLLGGGTIPDIIRSIAMGDLQYILPALGALFGFDEGPFPINLFNAAQKFFLGYVVPLPQFADVIMDIIWQWGSLIGLDPEFVENLRQALDAITDLFGTIGNFVTEFGELFDLLGIVNGDLGPFSALLSSIMKIFQGVDLTAFGNILDLLTDVLNPWIIQLTDLLNTVNEMIQAFSLGTTDLAGFLNFAQMFTNFIDFAGGGFDPVEAWANIITGALNPLGLITSILDPFAPLNASNLFNLGELLGSIGIGQIGTAQPNLLDNSSFREEISVQGGGIWVYDEVVGRTIPGSASVAAASVLRQLRSNAIRVVEGDELHLAIFARWAGLTYTGTAPIKLQAVRLLYNEITQSFAVMGTDTVDSFTSPATNQATWLELSGDYEVPANCTHIALQLVVEGTASAGSVWFDDAEARKTGMIKIPWVSGLSDDLDDIFGNLLEFFQLRDILGGNVVTPINSAIQDVKDWWSGVEGTFGDMGELFGGGDVEVPDNPISEAISEFFGLFFRGGSQSVVTQNKVAEPSGIPPLDADVRMPWEYLPVELMTVALGMPWCLIEKGSNQAITASTETLVTGLSQSGPATVILSGNKFKLPFDGMWHILAVTEWSSPSATAVTMNLRQNDVVIQKDGSALTGTITIPAMIPAATTDEFSVYVNTAASGLSVQASGTFIRATYMGQTTVPSLPPPLPPVTFDAAGGYDDGGDDTLNWNHTFGPNAKAIVVPISQENAGTPTVMCGPYNVPVLSGPSYIGNYFGANARCTLAAAILPDAVKGTTQAVTVTFPASLAGSATSMSFNNVGSLGSVITSSGNSNPYLNVPSNVKSMVAMHFGGMDVGFSSFNRTLVRSWGFSAFEHWAHMVGYAVGGAPFSASGGKWHGKGIELHP